MRHQAGDLTLAELSGSSTGGAQPVDTEVAAPGHPAAGEAALPLKWQYTQGKMARVAPRWASSTRPAALGMGVRPIRSTFYPFPWTSHLFQDSPSVAMGIFEGHMRKMAEGFKVVRQARMELTARQCRRSTRRSSPFDWKQFSDEEWHLCPPVVSIGGDGAMYDIGFQNLSRALASGVPIKVLVLDTQVYSNTGGQACTSGFTGQVADMSPHGKTWKGKTEIRKEMGLIGMAHRPRS